jgi:very-short-patch-repair endonuclease
MPTQQRKDGAGWRSSKEEKFHKAWMEENPFGPLAFEESPQLEPVREHRFHPVRRWRFDFAWPHLMVAVEIQGFGGNQRAGGHHSITGLTRDAEKTRAAILEGWTVIPITSNCISSKAKLTDVVQQVADILCKKGEDYDGT